jgi:FkbM family methyltransferase
MVSKAESWKYRWETRGVRRVCFEREGLEANGYLSQFGQDKWVAEVLLPNARPGVFVDVGAHDGISFSNTYYLERELGWSGLAVEPNPEMYTKLKRQRRCIALEGCVAPQDGRVRFLQISGYSQMLSGIVGEFDPRHKKRIENEVRVYGGSSREIEVDGYTLGNLLATYGLTHVDYLSLDVEGPEYLILESLDFRRFDVSVIGVENNYGDARMPRLLKAKGYSLHSIVGDEFYVKCANSST